MPAILLAKGPTAYKIVDDEGTLPIISFMGADSDEPHCAFGVGYMVESTRQGAIWGLVIPHFLIRSWRAMHLLQKMPRIQWDTLCCCWHSAQPSDTMLRRDREYVEKLRAQYGDGDAFDAVLSEVLNMRPSDDELVAMLVPLAARGIFVFPSEIRETLGPCSYEVEQILAYMKIEDDARWERGRLRVEATKVAKAKVPPRQVAHRSLWQRLFG